MRVRLKTRAILIYLSVVCFGTLFFGLYFLFAPSPPYKSRNGIERAAIDRWSGLSMHNSLLYQKAELDSHQPVDSGSDRERNPAYDDKDDEKLMQRPHAGEAVVLPPKSKLQNMTWDDLSHLYHSYTTQVQVACTAVERVGHVTDGGWEVCEETGYKPTSPCLVYSFGVGDDFSFDDAVARRYGCEVHSFDPSMRSGDHKRESSVQFHSLGLAHFTGKSSSGWEMSALPDIRKMLGHEGKPLSILKLDIEEWEWEVLPALLKGGHLSDTRQLLMELHQCEGCSRYNAEQIDKEATKERYIIALGILKDLYDAGFRIFWQHQNPACRYISQFTLNERSGCCELHMIQTKIEKGST